MRIEPPDATTRINQGDFVHWKGATDPLQRYGIVVTADCDLWWGKHWERLTVVPVMSVDDYCHHVLVPRVLTGLKERLVRKLVEQVTKAAKGSTGSEPSTAEHSAELILLDESFEENWKDTPEVVRCGRILRDLQGGSHYETPVACLRDALDALGSSASALEDRITSGLANPPGDVVVIPAPDVLGFQFAVAWLRMLREVNQSEVVSKLTDWTPGRAMRVARLGPVFRYRLTQRLAQVFSDIGLPNDYEADLKAYLGDRARAIANAGEQ